MRVTGVSQGVLGSLYRIDQPVRALRTIGHDSRLHVPRQRIYTSLWANQPPAIVFAQAIAMAHEQLEGVWADCFASRDFPVVIDFDDSYWDYRPSQPWFKLWNASHYRRLEKALANADAVITTNSRLADKLASFNDAVTVIPNFVDESVLGMERSRRQRLTVGWMGSVGHTEDFAAVAGPLGEFFDSEPDVDLHLVGDDHRATAGVRRGRFSRGTDYSVSRYWQNIDFDIGIAPLADNEYNRCRSHIKALEYGALGIPIVASDVGPYRGFVKHGKTGFLVKNDREWVTALRTLVHDEGLRARMGKAARKQASKHTIQANVWRYEQALEPLGAESGAVAR